MKFDKQTDSGVSPVIGVILMVAITVILSAIIASFVLGLGGTVSQNPQAGVSFDQNAPNSLQNVSDDDTEFEVNVQTVSMENADSVAVDFDGSEVGTMDGVGQTVTVNNSDSGLSQGDKLTVTATLEGKTSVIQTYTVD